MVKIPKWQFEKFPGADEDAGAADEVGRRSDGDRPDLQGSDDEGVRSLETGKKTRHGDLEPRRLTQRLVTPHPERLAYIRYAFERGMTVREVARMTSMDPWFLHQIREITD